MTRRVRLGLCLLSLLAVTDSTASAPPALSAEPMAAASEVLASPPSNPEPLCARADGGVEPCATRYPVEYREWQESVHGKAYLSGDSEAPGCNDCHDDPLYGGIRTADFRLDIPSRCARCHGDPELMRKRGLATDLYASYRAAYHGVTTHYYSNRSPAIWRYEAVCSDCHSSHAVFGASDSRSSVSSANLLRTCQQCHPGAETNFVSVSAGHLRTDRKSSLLLYCIALAYQILIPTIIGAMAAYIGLDVLCRLRKRSAGTA